MGKRELRLYLAHSGHWVITDDKIRVLKVFDNEQSALYELRMMQIYWPFKDAPKPLKRKKKKQR